MPIKHEVGRFRCVSRETSCPPLICRDLYGLCGPPTPIYNVHVYLCLYFVFAVVFVFWFVFAVLIVFIYFFVFVGRLNAIYNLQNIEFYAPTGACKWPFQKDDLTRTWSEWRFDNLLEKEKKRRIYFFCVKDYLIQRTFWSYEVNLNAFFRAKQQNCWSFTTLTQMTGKNENCKKIAICEKLVRGKLNINRCCTNKTSDCICAFP